MNRRKSREEEKAGKKKIRRKEGKKTQRQEDKMTEKRKDQKREEEKDNMLAITPYFKPIYVYRRATQVGKRYVVKL